MTTKQTDAVAMTEQQLDEVAGGAVFWKTDGVQGGIMRKGSSVSINEDGSITPIPKVLFPRGRARIVHPNY
jgi:hypothetical protein